MIRLKGAHRLLSDELPLLWVVNVLIAGRQCAPNRRWAKRARLTKRRLKSSGFPPRQLKTSIIGTLVRIILEG